MPQAKAHSVNILGEPMVFERNRHGRTINAGKHVLVNHKAKVVVPDVMGTNGVIHIVDQVLTTDTALPITALLEKRNSTVFARLLAAAELEEEFEDYDNVTFFVPTDKAFDDSPWKVALETDAESLKGNETLKKFLLYHVAEHIIGSFALHNGIIKTRAEENLIVNVFNPVS